MSGPSSASVAVADSVTGSATANVWSAGGAVSCSVGVWFCGVTISVCRPTAPAWSVTVTVTEYRPGPAYWCWVTGPGFAGVPSP